MTQHIVPIKAVRTLYLPINITRHLHVTLTFELRPSHVYFSPGQICPHVHFSPREIRPHVRYSLRQIRPYVHFSP